MMVQKLKIGLVSVILVAAPSLAHAQRGARMASFSSSSHSRGFAGVRIVQAGTRRKTSNSTQTQSVLTNSSLLSNSAFLGGGFPLTLQDLLNPVPGLGFDFAHLAAINHDLGIQALIDPVTQGRLAIAERLLRETPLTSTFFPFFDSGTPIVVVQQPPVVVVQQPPTVVEQPAPQAAAETEAMPATASAPLPDEGEFTLVLRDGAQIEALGFTHTGDRIIYVTLQGQRRSVAVKDLDSDATLRINEERGTPLQLPL